MLGMHGTVAANYAVDKADLLLAIGVRFDDRVTGKLEAFAARARIVHIDIDPAEINKNKASHITVCANARPSLQVMSDLSISAMCRLTVPPPCLTRHLISPTDTSLGLVIMPRCTTECLIGDSTQEMNRQLEERPVIKEQFDEWVAEVDNMGKEFPLMFPDRDDVIMPQWAIKVRLMKRICR